MNIERGRRQILIQGMLMVLVGLLWGTMIPVTPYPRLALTAHIQLELNGLVYVILGVLLIAVPNRVGARSIVVMLISVFCTWGLTLSEVANSWWGASKVLPIAAAQAGATGGEPWQDALMKVTHVLGALMLIVAWTLAVIGFWKKLEIRSHLATTPLKVETPLKYVEVSRPKNASATAEFIVHNASYCSEGFAIDGIVNEGNLLVGDVLSLPNSKVTVSVVEIHAFQYKFDVLWTGMGGRLIVSPPVPGQIRDRDSLRKV
ncbi:MAG: hypothetical protein AB7O26_10485 [Planctomycetaceae bacterium]